MAVVAAFKLDDLAAASGTASQAQCAHGGFSLSLPLSLSLSSPLPFTYYFIIYFYSLGGYEGH